MTLPKDREFDLLSIGTLDTFWDALWLELWPFLCLYGRISYNCVSTLPNDREFDLLSIGTVDTFWDALWLELWPFFVFVWKNLVELRFDPSKR